MKQDKKKFFKWFKKDKSNLTYLLRSDPMYKVDYNYTLNPMFLGEGYYKVTIERLVQNNLKEWIFRKEEVILKKVAQLNDKIIVLDILDKEILYAPNKQ